MKAMERKNRLLESSVSKKAMLQRQQIITGMESRLHKRFYNRLFDINLRCYFNDNRIKILFNYNLYYNINILQ